MKVCTVLGFRSASIQHDAAKPEALSTFNYVLIILALALSIALALLGAP
jgi:hypothetical protein